MARIVLCVLLVIAVWVGITLHREGPEKAFGGLFDLLGSPQYGEADRPTRSGRLADRVEEVPPPEEPEGPWWAEP